MVTGAASGIGKALATEFKNEKAKDVIDAIQKERFLVTPHEEVLEYIRRKTTDYDRWITGMQSLQGRFEEFYEDFKDQ